jgi:hypothetical protein
MSSTNNKCVIIVVPTMLIPLKNPFRLASKISLFKDSATIRNKKGANGHPYLRPQVALKFFDSEPLTNTTKLVDSRHPITQLTDCRFMLVCKSTNLKKNQLTLSYALERSIFITIIACFPPLIEWKPSYDVPTAS